MPRYRPPPVFQRPTRAEHNRAVRDRPSEGVLFASPKRARGGVLPTTERLSDRGRERGCDRQPSCYSDPRRQQKRGAGLRARSCTRCGSPFGWTKNSTNFHVNPRTKMEPCWMATKPSSECHCIYVGFLGLLEYLLWISFPIFRS